METMKLYPPLLESSIPAFTSQINIPFAHNTLVGYDEFSAFWLQIKELNGNVIYNNKIEWEKGTDEILKIASPTEMIQANWYKFQIAYVDNNGNIGHYSSAAVGKYLGDVNEENFGLSFIKTTVNGVDSIKGIYKHSIDPTEKEYSYQFILKDSDNNVLVDSGIQLHNVNSSKDLKDESYDIFKCCYCLTKSHYILLYKVTTINGYVLSASMRLNQNYFDSNLNVIPFEIMAKFRRENGSVAIYTKYRNQIESNVVTRSIRPHIPNTKEDGTTTTITGSFVLRRTCSKDNYFRIFTIKTFSLVNVPITEIETGFLLYQDFTVESGYSYKYYIQQFNKTGTVYSQVKSTMTDNKEITISFEDSYLYDGERQLNIKFNPKISSFKANILSNKTDTIGSQYPFINYNAVVNYKEFPISGLISYNMDETEDFMRGFFPPRRMRGDGPSDDVLARQIYNTGRPHLWNYTHNVTNLDDYNIQAEKEFKLAVLDYLNNKKPKLFRSSTEGNYVVMTMNSSLSPNDTLGRMLHTFSCTAYEVMSLDDFMEEIIEKTAFQDIYSTGIIGNLQDDLDVFRSFSAEPEEYNCNLCRYGEYAKMIQIREAPPMSKITLGIVKLPNYYNITFIPITIGATGSYNYVCFNNNEYIKAVYLGDRSQNFANKPNFCNITLHNILSIKESIFDKITDISTNTILGKQLSSPFDKDENTRMIQYFYTPPTTESYRYLTLFNKIHLLKIRNFDTLHSVKVTYSFGPYQHMIQEIKELQLEEVVNNSQSHYEMAVSFSLKNFLTENSNIVASYFDNNWQVIERNEDKIREKYDSKLPSAYHYLTYKTIFNNSNNFETFKSTVEQLLLEEENNNKREIILKPTDTKDVYFNKELSNSLTEDGEYSILQLEPYDLVIYPSTLYINDTTSEEPIISKDVYYDLYGDFSKVYFYEGDLIAGEGSESR